VRRAAGWFVGWFFGAEEFGVAGQAGEIHFVVFAGFAYEINMHDHDIGQR
jgi:hypothetical protein